MPKQRTGRAKRVTYSLEPVYQDLLREISFVTRRPMSDELRMLIDARAQILGLTPVNVVDPKSSALHLETTAA